MSDQTTDPTNAPAAPAPAAPPASSAPSQQEAVSYDRFTQVNEKLKAEAEARRAAEAQLKALQRQGQSEAERAIAERDDALAAAAEAQRARDEALSLVEQQKRSSMLRDAAAAAGFIDPADAVARLAGSDIKTAAAAEREVKALADAAPHLVKSSDDSAGRKLERVLANGQPAPAPADGEPPVDPAAEQLLAQIKAAQASSWTSSPVSG